MTIPHLVQYQGSKRRLASQILPWFPDKSARLIEPFSGMAAISLAAASADLAQNFLINDINRPLAALLQEAVDNPDQLAKAYETLWKEQFTTEDGHIGHFYQIREKFNSGQEDPAIMLYLLARCVKGSIRYGKNGKFNQSPDKRRHGTNPEKMAGNILAISSLLKGRVQFSHRNYAEILEEARKGDLVYMDPPYQGVSGNRDNRYFAVLDFDDLCGELKKLDDRNVDYLVSYDGSCGEKFYVQELPGTLGCKKIMLNAGPSTQQTLLGSRATTFEALYISRNLYKKAEKQSVLGQLSLF